MSQLSVTNKAKENIQKKLADFLFANPTDVERVKGFVDDLQSTFACVENNPQCGIEFPDMKNTYRVHLEKYQGVMVVYQVSKKDDVTILNVLNSWY